MANNEFSRSACKIPIYLKNISEGNTSLSPHNGVAADVESVNCRLHCSQHFYQNSTTLLPLQTLRPTPGKHLPGEILFTTSIQFCVKVLLLSGSQSHYLPYEQLSTFTCNIYIPNSTSPMTLNTCTERFKKENPAHK